IGISRVSIYRAANRGDIPLVKLGGRTLVEVSDLDAYIANHKTTAAASFTVTIKWPLSPNA
ncbi:MAG: helix-turn-helix domain-containing protein, partial [Hyphomonadaceae bacterium]